MIELEIIKLLLEYANKLAKPAKQLYKQKKMGFSETDIELLEFFYACFDRPAFSVPFSHEMPTEFIQAIEDTIYAINVGIRRDRNGKIILKGKGKSEIDSAELRAKFDAVSALLFEIRNTFD